jgi:hypothetical protein
VSFPLVCVDNFFLCIFYYVNSHWRSLRQSTQRKILESMTSFQIHIARARLISHSAKNLRYECLIQKSLENGSVRHWMRNFHSIAIEHSPEFQFLKLSTIEFLCFFLSCHATIIGTLNALLHSRAFSCQALKTFNVTLNFPLFGANYENFEGRFTSEEVFLRDFIISSFKNNFHSEERLETLLMWMISKFHGA